MSKQDFDKKAVNSRCAYCLPCSYFGNRNANRTERHGPQGTEQGYGQQEPPNHIPVFGSGGGYGFGMSLGAL
jgi:hypothetical protein